MSVPVLETEGEEVINQSHMEAGMDLLVTNSSFEFKEEKGDWGRNMRPNHYGCRFTCHGYIMMKIH